MRKSLWPLCYIYVPGVIVTAMDSTPGNSPAVGLPAHTYQILSSETTESEIQCTVGMSCGYNGANILFCHFRPLHPVGSFRQL